MCRTFAFENKSRGRRKVASPAPENPFETRTHMSRVEDCSELWVRVVPTRYTELGPSTLPVTAGSKFQSFGGETSPEVLAAEGARAPICINKQININK